MHRRMMPMHDIFGRDVVTPITNSAGYSFNIKIWITKAYIKNMVTWKPFAFASFISLMAYPPESVVSMEKSR